MTLLLPRCKEWRRGLALTILCVRLSVKRVICDKTKGSCARILHERLLTLVLRQEEWLVAEPALVGGGDPFYLELWVKLTALYIAETAKSPIFSRYSFVAPQL